MCSCILFLVREAHRSFAVFFTDSLPMSEGELGNDAFWSNTWGGMFTRCYSETVSSFFVGKLPWNIFCFHCCWYELCHKGQCYVNCMYMNHEWNLILDIFLSAHQKRHLRIQVLIIAFDGIPPF